MLQTKAAYLSKRLVSRYLMQGIFVIPKGMSESLCVVYTYVFFLLHVIYYLVSQCSSFLPQDFELFLLVYIVGGVCRYIKSL